MDMHKNARSCPASRALLIERHEQGWSVRAAAEAIGISERRGWTWLARHRAEEGLNDRSSRPRQVQRISAEERSEILRLRRQLWTCRRIAGQTARSLSTVARVVQKAGLSRLRDLAAPPAPPVVRYEYEKPGDLLHIDIKKLGRITGGGGMNRHDRPGRTRGGGWEFVHVCVDDFTRLAYAEILPDERATSVRLFLEHAVRWFGEHGVVPKRVLTDNGLCYRSALFREACARAGMVHKRTRPYRPQTNGKAERFNQTLQREWSYAFAFRSSEQRAAALQPFLHYYNHHRAHTALGDQPPISRLDLNNVLTRDTEARPPSGYVCEGAFSQCSRDGSDAKTHPGACPTFRSDEPLAQGGVTRLLLTINGAGSPARRLHRLRALPERERCRSGGGDDRRQSLSARCWACSDTQRPRDPARWRCRPASSPPPVPRFRRRGGR